MSDPCTKDITALRISSLLILTRRRKWNRGFFERPGFGDFNDENPLKWLRSVPVVVDREEEDYLGRRGRPEGGGTSIIITH